MERDNEDDLLHPRSTQPGCGILFFHALPSHWLHDRVPGQRAVLLCVWIRYRSTGADRGADKGGTRGSNSRRCAINTFRLRGYVAGMGLSATGRWTRRDEQKRYDARVCELEGVQRGGCRVNVAKRALFGVRVTAHFRTTWRETLRTKQVSNAVREAELKEDA